MGNRYKIWRSTGAFAHAIYVLIVADPPEGPHTNWETRVPEALRKAGGGFWTGYKGGLLSRLPPVYRRVLTLQGFMVLSGLNQATALERPPRRRIRLRPGCFNPTLAACQRSNSSPLANP
jgi:hypothetical protein